MSASWAQVLTDALAIAGGLGLWLWGQGRAQGKLGQVLDELTRIAADHEDRLRHLEKARR